MTPDPDGRPHERPVPVLILAVIVGVLLLAVILWVLLPDTPLTVALIGIVVITAVGLALWRILSLPQLSQEPDGRTPDTPEGNK